jgi:hypothetical protein
MDFQQLLAKMVELDRPTTETTAPIVSTEACGDPIGMTPTMADQTPPPAHPSMSVNLNAQGMDNIESLMKLMTKVNPDMINQPQGGMPPMPSLTPPGPSISSIGDLGNLDAGPLKMLPDMDKDHAEPDADNMGGPSDNDADNKIDIVKLGKKEEESSEDDDEDDIMTHLNKELKPYDDQVAKDKDKEEAFVNSLDDSEPETMDIDAAIPNGNDLHKQKSMHRAAAGGDNAMKAEGTDLRAQIRAELQQRLAEAKGAK